MLQLRAPQLLHGRGDAHVTHLPVSKLLTVNHNGDRTKLCAALVLTPGPDLCSISFVNAHKFNFLQVMWTHTCFWKTFM